MPTTTLRYITLAYELRGVLIRLSAIISEMGVIVESGDRMEPSGHESVKRGMILAVPGFTERGTLRIR